MLTAFSIPQNDLSEKKSCQAGGAAQISTAMRVLTEIIASDVSLLATGKIEGDSNVRIGGNFKGDIQIKGDLHIEKSANLSAKIHAPNVIIAGEVEGNVISAGSVKVLESGQLIGDLKANTLTVAAGSRMRGHVEFGWNTSEVTKFVNGRSDDDKIEKNGNAG